MKKKNINVRVDGEVFNEIQAVSWFLDISRSNLVRDMIEHFCQKGFIEIDGQEYPYQQIVELSLQRLHEKNMNPEDLIQSKKSEGKEHVFSNTSEIEELAKKHVKTIRKAWMELLDQEPQSGRMG